MAPIKSALALYIGTYGSILEELVAPPLRYIHTNGDYNKPLEKYLWSLYRASEENGFEDAFYRIGALINTFKKRHNFSWEREWRIIGELEVEPANIFAIISENPEIELPDEYQGIPIINPLWSYEEIVYQLSLQLWNMRK